MTGLTERDPLPRQDDAFAGRLEAVRSEIDLPPAFRLLLGRDRNLWRGRRVFGPHISTAALWEVAERYDARA